MNFSPRQTSDVKPRKEEGEELRMRTREKDMNMQSSYEETLYSFKYFDVELHSVTQSVNELISY